eukprot:g6889.t1
MASISVTQAQRSRYMTEGNATGGKTWITLYRIFCERLSFVRAMKSAGKVPNIGQLVTFISRLEQQLNAATKGHMDDYVKSVLVKEFGTQVHWDWTTFKPIQGSSPPSPGMVEKFLWNMQRLCRTEEAKLQKQLIGDANPTAAELNSLPDACSRLWRLDTPNRLTPGKDYILNLQQGKKPYQTGDRAAEKLFTAVNPEVMQRTTYKALYNLLDNYCLQTGVTERVTNEERSEERKFIEAIFQKDCMKYVFNYCKQKNVISGDLSKFKQFVHDLWFKLYRRDKKGDSCAFEHVFVGEERRGKLMGMHNWIRLYSEEKKGRMDYLGFIKPKGRQSGHPQSPKSQNQSQVVTLQFSEQGEIKPVSTSFIGVSPEFEIALYTLIYLCGEEENPLEHLGPYSVNIKSFKYGHGKNTSIGSVFPEAMPLSRDAAATRVQAVYRGRKARKRCKNIRRTRSHKS